MSLSLFISEKADQTVITELRDKWTLTTFTINEDVSDDTFAVLVVVHPEWQTDSWLTSDDDALTKYISEAMQQGKRIIPVMIDDAALTEDGMATSLKKLAGRAGVSLTPNDVFVLSDQVAELVDRLTKLMPKSSDVPQAKQAVPAPDVTSTKAQAETSIAATSQVQSTNTPTVKSETSSAASSVYAPIRLAPPRYLGLFIQSGLIAFIPFAILGVSAGATESTFAPGEYYHNGLSDLSPTLVAVVAAITGALVGYLWRDRLPNESYMPFIVGATWGAAFYLLVDGFVEPTDNSRVIAACVVMALGHFAAFWLPEHKRWWQFNFKTLRMSLYIPFCWLLGMLIALIAGVFAVDAYRSSTGFEDDFTFATIGDAQTAAIILYTFLGTIGIAFTSIFILAVLRRIARKAHPEFLEVIDESS